MKFAQEVKKRLRINIKRKTLKGIKIKSISIKEKISALPQIRSARNICIYVSTKNEVETGDLIKELLKEKDKKVYVPFLKETTMGITQIFFWSDLCEKNRFGIMEPQQKKEYFGKLDMVIVPGLVFDVRGNRLGHGGGCYDKFLIHRPKALKIGLALEEQIILNLPTEQQDIKMDLIVTEKRIINCNNLVQ